MRKRVTKMIWAAMAAAVLCSCASSHGLMRSDIPRSKYLVGGGTIITYEAPADGTAYWVEETTARVLATQSLKKSKEFDLDASEPGVIERLYGIPLAGAKFSLYFVHL